MSTGPLQRKPFGVITHRCKLTRRRFCPLIHSDARSMVPSESMQASDRLRWRENESIVSSIRLLFAAALFTSKTHVNPKKTERIANSLMGACTCIPMECGLFTRRPHFQRSFQSMYLYGGRILFLQRGKHCCDQRTALCKSLSEDWPPRRALYLLPQV